MSDRQYLKNFIRYGGRVIGHLWQSHQLTKAGARRRAHDKQACVGLAVPVEGVRVVIHINAEAERIGADQALLTERLQQRLAGRQRFMSRSGRDNQFIQHMVLQSAIALTQGDFQLLRVSVNRHEASGQYLQTTLLLSPGDDGGDLWGNAIAMHIPP